MNESITFAQPVWLYLILALIPLLILRFRSRRFRELAVGSLVSSRLRPHLIVGERTGRHWGQFGVQLFALACLLLALARPQFGLQEEKLLSEGRNLIIAIDTSRSMLADDVQPSRLARAQLTSQDLVAFLPKDRIGLIAFAGTSFLQAPLTVDHEAVVESITQLDTHIIPRGGTNIGRAIALARKTFAKSGSQNNALILFSDGEDLETGPAAADPAVDPSEIQMTLVAVGVGTTGGAIIPDPDAKTPGKFMEDADGKIVRSRLDPDALKKYAQEHGGVYLSLDSTGSVKKVVSRALDQLDATTEESKTIRKPIERYRWPLAAGIIALFLSLVPRRIALPESFSARRPRRVSPAQSASASAIACALTLLPMKGTAGPARDASLLYGDEKYREAFGKYREALEESQIFEDQAEVHYGAGSASYKVGDFQQAIRSYGNALLSEKAETQERVHYGLGNALYREGEARLEKPAEALVQWGSAVEHYEAALALDPENEDAQYNLDLVKKRIEELQQQQQQQEDQQQQENQSQDQQQQDQNQQNQGKGENEGKSGDQEQEQEQKDRDQSEGDSESEEQERQNQGQDQQEQQQNQSEPVEEGETPEGQLQADADQPPEQREGGMQPEEQPHPETGFTRSQARQILRSLADEDLNVRPLVPPSPDRAFKNW